MHKILCINLFVKIPLLFSLTLLFGCSGSSDKGSTELAGTIENDAKNAFQTAVMASENNPEEWEWLFDGRNLQKWRSMENNAIPSDAWLIEEGVLVLGPKGGNIITRDKFSDFELVWEFKLTKGANSGIKYFVDTLINSETGKIYVNGPEYQIIDDLNHDEIKEDPNGLSSTGALYLLYAPQNKFLNPAGQWNQARIISQGKKVEHWLNGKKLVSYERGSQDFKNKMADTKFRDYPEYGQIPAGHILLTDHQDKVYFRNIKIRTLSMR